MKNTQRLWQRYGTWYYRRAVPKHLVGKIGEKLIVYSLGGKDLTEAKKLREFEDVKWSARFDAAEKGSQQKVAGVGPSEMATSTMSRPTPTSSDGSMNGLAGCRMQASWPTTFGGRWARRRTPISRSISHGAARAAGGICATLRDLARFGEMMRNRGVSNGKQVVPGWWINDIRKGGDADAWLRGKLVAVFPNGNYRSKWYTIDRGREAFGAVGIHGQWIYVDPEDEAVIVRVSSQPLAMDLGLDRMWVRGYRAITSSLSH